MRIPAWAKALDFVARNGATEAAPLPIRVLGDGFKEYSDALIPAKGYEHEM
jgi:hypothetical protein